MAGPRFGVVLQRDELLTLSTVIVAPTSTQVRPASFRPEVVVAGERTRVVIEQLRAVDLSRLVKSEGLLSWAEMERVDRALGLVLAL